MLYKALDASTLHLRPDLLLLREPRRQRSRLSAAQPRWLFLPEAMSRR